MCLNKNKKIKIMGKARSMTNKKRIKQLEKDLMDFKINISGFMEFVGYKGKEYISVFENGYIQESVDSSSEFSAQLRAIEAKYERINNL